MVVCSMNGSTTLIRDQRRKLFATSVSCTSPQPVTMPYLVRNLLVDTRSSLAIVERTFTTALYKPFLLFRHRRRVI